MGGFIQNQRGKDTPVATKAAKSADESKTDADAKKAAADAAANAEAVRNAAEGPFKPNGSGFALVKRLKGHQELVYGNAILPDQRHAVSGGHDDTLKVWDITAGVEVKSFPSPVGDIHGIQVAADGKRVLLYSFRTDQIAIFDISEGKTIASIKAPTERLSSASWDSDQQTVYVLCNDVDGGVYHWDPTQGAVIQQFANWPRAAYQIFSLRAETTGGTPQLLVVGCTMKPNPNSGPNAAPLINDKPWAGIFSLPDHHHVRDLPDYTNIRNRLSLSPDGSTILGGLGSLYLLDVPALTTRFTVNSPGNLQCTSSNWADDGRLLVAGYADGSVSIVEAETGFQVTTLNVGLRPTSVSLSKDESWMLVSGFPFDMKQPKPGDFDLLVVRLPDLKAAGSDKSYHGLAKRQLADLERLDPELATLRSQAIKAAENPQFRELANKYGAALKRLAPTAPPAQQLAMNAEADAIASGQPVPDPSTDAATQGEHQRMRGIYRQQVEQLAASGQTSTRNLPPRVTGSFKDLADKRRVAGDRMGAIRCEVLLGILDVRIPVTKNLAASTPAPPPAPMPEMPIKAPTAPPPTAPPLTVAKPSFANEVKIEVAIGRPSKIKGGDFDDKTQVMQPRIKLTNTSLNQAYEGYKASFMLLGESTIDTKIIQVMQREEFPVSLAARLFLDKELPETVTQYDTTGVKFGYKYEGWIMQVTGPGGEIVYTKSTAPSLEKMPEQVQQLKAGTTYDRKLKVVPEPSRFRL